MNWRRRREGGHFIGRVWTEYDVFVSGTTLVKTLHFVPEHLCTLFKSRGYITWMALQLLWQTEWTAICPPNGPSLEVVVTKQRLLHGHSQLGDQTSVMQRRIIDMICFTCNKQKDEAIYIRRPQAFQYNSYSGKIPYICIGWQYDENVCFRIKYRFQSKIIFYQYDNSGRVSSVLNPPELQFNDP